MIDQEALEAELNERFGGGAWIRSDGALSPIAESQIRGAVLTALAGYGATDAELTLAEIEMIVVEPSSPREGHRLEIKVRLP